MESVFAQNPDEYNSIKYQVDFPMPGDPYYTTEVGNRRGFYGVNGIPSVEIDGGWNQHSLNLTQAVFDQFQNEACFVEMTADFQTNFKTIDATVNITPLTDINSNNLALYAVIYGTTYNNVGTNGEIDFKNVMKKMLIDSLPPINANDTITKHLSYTFNGNYILPPSAQSPANLNTEHTVENFNNLGVIAWVQDTITKEVFQSVNASTTCQTLLIFL